MSPHHFKTNYEFAGQGHYFNQTLYYKKEFECKTCKIRNIIERTTKFLALNKRKGSLAAYKQIKKCRNYE
ncbi:hypothetical protein Gasu2_64450 [Galdieria sulphuraria]|nr:hypothetical protein Gasu2_64450 [Galdieria sulphuraria]